MGVGTGVDVGVSMRIGVGVSMRVGVAVDVVISGRDLWTDWSAASVTQAKINAKVRNPIRPQESATNCLVHILNTTKYS